MRVLKRAATVAMAAGLFFGVGGAAAASAATAAPQWKQVWLTGTETSVTTAPGIAAALLSHGIVPLAVLPGTEGASIGGGNVAVKFTFPVTGGWVNLATLHGTIYHSGGILFTDPATGRQIEVGNFIINVHQGTLTAEVNNTPSVRVPLLDISLAHASVYASGKTVRISGIVLTLTAAAASALDGTFGTTLFGAGLELGTASTTLSY
jgi:hypothetical protein